MMDLNLRAATREAIDLALTAADLISAEGQTASERVLIDYIGPITRQTGVDGNGDPIMQTIPDYHANLRLLDGAAEAQIAALAGVTIAPPNAPYRVWA